MAQRADTGTEPWTCGGQACPNHHSSSIAREHTAYLRNFLTHRATDHDLPMVLNDDEILSFVQAWKADFGEVLPMEKARDELNRLLLFFSTIERLYHPQSAQHVSKFHRRGTIAK